MEQLESATFQLMTRPQIETTRYFCYECDKSFSKKSSLDRHKVIHTGEKQFLCDKCEKSFSQKNNLDAHMRIHLGIKPYSCKKCGKTFTQSQNCRKHKQNCGDGAFSGKLVISLILYTIIRREPFLSE